MSEINGTENARRLDHPQCVHGAARCNKAAQIRERALAARSARVTPECGPTTPAASLLRRLGSASCRPSVVSVSFEVQRDKSFPMRAVTLL